VDDRIALVEELFTAWSSGDPDAPRTYLTEDAVLDDVIGGVYRGWPAIRAYFARGLASWPDLRLEPTGEWWSRDDGLAFTWVMSATVADDRFGPGTAGPAGRLPA
jgi:ketosteroid isomerase-like protein